MGIDIGHALRDGASRTAAKNGLVLAAVFAGIALLITVLMQSLTIVAFESLLETFQSIPPQEMGVSQTEHEQMITDLETALEQIRSTAVLALDIPIAAAGAGVIALALVGEAVSIVAVRVFATDDAVTGESVTDNLALATLNGIVGKIVVYVLIGIGLVLLVIPGIFLAVMFFFLRQEIAINDKNFVQAMADSWRLTRGNRIEVFIVGAVLLIASQLEGVVDSALDLVSTTVGTIGATIVGGLLTAFALAVITRAYVQLQEPSPPPEAPPREEPEDPYDAALGPDDLSR